jgi:hypothetical protein
MTNKDKLFEQLKPKGTTKKHKAYYLEGSLINKISIDAKKYKVSESTIIETILKDYYK